ncbi:alpha/beta-hydrolase [Pleomassaria siparia CBS 279.74]|uniref:Alpha/beta-hydrolase n=1 Tax=Pleomassaria siparia CBS 279.74 TaxID=1314801 RepID=A0A6G1KFK2_9PLEO|nr:alpha/beta-hydrolase [Pleomassaria siparia CBS 279.74]
MPPPNPPTTTIHQPLHPTLLPTLDSEYTTFHNLHMQHVPRDESQPWDGSARTTPSLPYGGSCLVDVGSTRDIRVGDFCVRVFTPEGEGEGDGDGDGDDDDGDDGWPVFVWFHGGGWAIVITVAYRLAPEHIFPAAIDDALAAMHWIHTQPLRPTTRLDLANVAIGGTSAGANIAIVLALRMLEDQTSFPWPLAALVLIVPVVDNTATIMTTTTTRSSTDDDDDSQREREEEASIWYPNRHAPWLTSTRMLWYRHMYMPDTTSWSSWAASPNLAPTSLLAKLPRTWIAVSECDLLAPEALQFAGLLEGLGVDVEKYVVQGGTHSILALNGVLEKGRLLVEKAVNIVRNAFWGIEASIDKTTRLGDQ